ncbi:hypothetical protein BGX34_001906 [Mortierella sp. NVP85]|nr:hypothetical protein BGX34_001906 [Mortierella sp. NVP85]
MHTFTSSDVQTVAQKLTAFLDTFDEAYQEMIPQAEAEEMEMTIERVYGDCSEIMTTLFNAVERESSLKKADQAKCMQEPLDKALALINLILKEDKYRRQVAEAPDFISRLLSLLEKPGSPDTKILILRIIATIGESDRNKIEIAKRMGYKKILRLLIAENPELTQEVVRTVNHLLEFQSKHPQIADLALVAPTPAPAPTSGKGEWNHGVQSKGSSIALVPAIDEVSESKFITTTATEVANTGTTITPWTVTIRPTSSAKQQCFVR